MSLLISDEIKQAIYEELESATHEVHIISAYCKYNAFEFILKHIPASVSSKKLLLRFRLDDLISGSTDFRILERCREQNWKVYIRFDLHAKTYIIDKKRGIVGSANATGKGLSLSMNGNLEIATLVNISESDRRKIDILFSEAILIDDELFEQLKLQYNSAINNGIVDNKQKKWSRDIEDLFTPDITTLFSYDFPDEVDINNDSIFRFLGLPIETEIETIVESFKWCRCNLWLRKILKEHDGEIYYGELSALLHEAIIEDPKPYRKDIKKLLSNQIKWIEILAADDIIIDRPNYSQRLRFRNQP